MGADGTLDASIGPKRAKKGNMLMRDNGDDGGGVGAFSLKLSEATKSLDELSKKARAAGSGFSILKAGPTI